MNCKSCNFRIDDTMKICPVCYTPNEYFVEQKESTLDDIVSSSEFNKQNNSIRSEEPQLKLKEANITDETSETVFKSKTTSFFIANSIIMYPVMLVLLELPLILNFDPNRAFHFIYLIIIVFLMNTLIIGLWPFADVLYLFSPGYYFVFFILKILITYKFHNRINMFVYNTGYFNFLLEEGGQIPI